MKKLYLAIACLTLMQTSAFSILFTNDLTDQNAIITAGEGIDRTFTYTFNSHDPVTYAPAENSFGQYVTWMKGQDIIQCPLRYSRKSLKEEYKIISLTRNGCSVL